MARPQTIDDLTLKELARQVFLERGESATINEIAAKVPLSVPGILKRAASFAGKSKGGTKHDLFVAVMMPERVNAEEMLKRLAVVAASRDRLITAAETILK